MKKPVTVLMMVVSFLLLMMVATAWAQSPNPVKSALGILSKTHQKFKSIPVLPGIATSASTIVMWTWFGDEVTACKTYELETENNCWSQAYVIEKILDQVTDLTDYNCRNFHLSDMVLDTGLKPPTNTELDFDIVPQGMSSVSAVIHDHEWVDQDVDGKTKSVEKQTLARCTYYFTDKFVVKKFSEDEGKCEPQNSTHINKVFNAPIMQLDRCCADVNCTNEVQKYLRDRREQFQKELEDSQSRLRARQQKNVDQDNTTPIPADSAKESDSKKEVVKKNTDDDASDDDQSDDDSDKSDAKSGDQDSKNKNNKQDSTQPLIMGI